MKVALGTGILNRDASSPPRPRQGVRGLVVPLPVPALGRIPIVRAQIELVLIGIVGAVDSAPARQLHGVGGVRRTALPNTSAAGFFGK